MTIWIMRIACWIPKATNTHTGCVIVIAFPLEQWLHEGVAMLRYTYIACRVLLRDAASYYRTGNSDTRLRRPKLSYEPGCFIPQRKM
jgi:hypothetical protein